MKQQNISKQSKQHEGSRTRNQRKRELRRIICMSAALLIMWMMLCTIFIKAWCDHPAEQPVNGLVYLEMIQDGGDSDGNLQD